MRWALGVEHESQIIVAVSQILRFALELWFAVGAASASLGLLRLPLVGSSFLKPIPLLLYHLLVEGLARRLHRHVGC